MIVKNLMYKKLSLKYLSSFVDLDIESFSDRGL